MASDGKESGVQQMGARVASLLIVDDHALVREGWKRLLDGSHEFVVAGEAGTAAQALALFLSADWDIVVLDLSLPDRNGVELLKDMVRARPMQTVLVCTVYSEHNYAIRALRAGAAGFVSKSAPPSDLLVALRKLKAGGKYITSELAETLADTLQHPERELPHQRLSDREFEVLTWMTHGRSTREIAHDLGLSVKTVASFRSRILTKLGVSSTAAAIRYAMENNLVE